MQFHDGVTLWKSFIVFRQPTWTTWRKRNPLAGKESFDINLRGGTIDDRLANAVYGRVSSMDAPEEGQVSTDDVERLLEFQVEEMQSRLPPCGCPMLLMAERCLEVGNRMPDDVKTQFRKMLDSNVTTPSLSHYVKYFSPHALLIIFATFSYDDVETHGFLLQILGLMAGWRLPIFLRQSPSLL